MGGVQQQRAKEVIDANRYVKRPEKLKGARDAYVKRTGGKLRAVETAGMYKDMTRLEKKRYQTLMDEDKKQTTLGV